MRIAAHNGARDFGGGEKWTLLLLRGLQGRGHDVRFFCRDEVMADRAAAYGVPAEPGRLGGHLMLSDAWRLGRTLRRYRPDVLLVSTYKKIWLAGMAARLAGVPRVVARVGLSTDLPGRHWTYRLALRRWTDAVLVNADGIRRDFVRDLPGYDPGRVATVYDGIDLAASSAAAAPADRRAVRSALGIGDGERVVGTVTRLSAQKRIDRMLEAFELLPDDTHLVLAGSGELEDELRAAAGLLDGADRVHFLGFRDDVAGVLALLDVFLLTSDKEGMANAMLEAMAAGIPVVSTPVSGAAEALGPRTPSGPAAGLDVDADPEALADAVGRLLSDPALATALGAEGRRRARTDFSYERMLDAWERVLGGADPASVHQCLCASPCCVHCSASSDTAARSTAVSPE